MGTRLLIPSKDNELKYVYIHGFNSAYDPASVKVQALQQIGEVTGVTYNSFNTYPSIFDDLLAQIPQRDVVLVGTSLGGFWAAEMARHLGLLSVIINPAIEPRVSLRKYVGQSLMNYVTGATSMLTMDVVESYQVAITRATTFLPLVLLDMGDEIIDAHATHSALEGFPMICWDVGSHRFEHMDEAIQHIAAYVNHARSVQRSG